MNSRAEMCKAEGHLGAMEKLNLVILRIEDMEKTEFPSCLNDLDTIIKAISAGSYNSLVEARKQVEWRCNRFDNMVQELLSYREFFDALEQDSPPEEVPEP